MSSEFNLDQVDADGAIRETAQGATETLEETGDTRADFFKKAGMAGGALMGGGALLSALVPGTAMGANSRAIATPTPPAAFGSGDVGILNYALTLEYLERAFYDEATKNNNRKSFLKGNEREFLKTTTKDERAHVRRLSKALGSAAVKEPKFDFGKTTNDRKLFLKTAFALENTGVGAYLGQGFNISNPNYLKVALQILCIEARHAGLVGSLVGGARLITPTGAFEDSLSPTEVLKAVDKTGFIKG